MIERHHDTSEPRAGFTLLEVLMAMGILALGLLVLAAMQLHALSGGRTGRHTTQALTIAQDELDRLQRVPFAMLSYTSAWTTTSSISSTVYGSAAAEQTYNLEHRIADDVTSWTKNVDVRVTWDEPDDPGRTLVMSTRRYNW